MDSGQLLRAVDRALPALGELLGERLAAVYSVGSIYPTLRQQLPARANLLFIFRDMPDPGQLRTILRRTLPTILAAGEVGVVISDQGKLERHLKLQPLLAEHLARSGLLLTGERQSFDSIEVDHLDRMARLAGRAMIASACLAPALLPPREYQELSRSLEVLATDLRPTPENVSGGSAVVLLAQIEALLAKRMRTLPHFRPEEISTIPSPPLLPELIAVYEWNDSLLLILPDHTPEKLAAMIETINWQSVASRVADQYRALRVTTPSQLRLIAERETPADFVLKNFDHVWGTDSLAGLKVAARLVLRDLARLPSEMELALIPQAYIGARNDDLAMLIHDLQNKLLNIQLRDELYRRLNGSPAVKPPRALPDRSALPRERIKGIMEYCNWWTEQYVLEMDMPATASP